uniref:Uncharacterized protein n=1 Tax=Setaria viridis TaxID=4556 RepID=A0A4U6T178_SETVI|nr:hypothetical protein SEVIR_9G354300v2 [Setaria viridis]
MVGPTEGPHSGNGVLLRRLSGKPPRKLASGWQPPPSCQERLPRSRPPYAMRWVHTAASGRGEGLLGRVPGSELNAPYPRMMGPN